MNRRALCLISLIGLCMAYSAQAALIVPVQHKLHCYAQASHSMLGQSKEDKPTDLVVGAMYGSYSQQAEARVEGMFQVGPDVFVAGSSHALARVGSTVVSDSLLMSAYGEQPHPSGNPDGGSGKAEADVSVTFDLMGATQFDLMLSVSSYALGSMIITANGQRVGAMSLPGYMPGDWLPPGHTQKGWITSLGSSIVLEPGRYEVEVSYSPMPHVGILVGGTVEFSMAAVPEPGALGMVVMMGVGLLGMRRR